MQICARSRLIFDFAVGELPDVFCKTAPIKDSDVFEKCHWNSTGIQPHCYE
jgi:hypothetical protein